MPVQPVVNPIEVLRILRSHRRYWLFPAIAGMLLAAGYACLRTPTWEASQALALRNEAANNSEGPGRFRQAEDMKVTQETLLEIAKSQQVLAAALEEVGPIDGCPPGDYPTLDNLIELRDSILLSPPKGTEFGKTEIVYLKVKTKHRAQVAQLVSAVCRHTQLGLQRLRQTKAQSMVDELAKAAAVAQADLQHSTTRLGTMEREVGSDLGELRMLELSGTADSDLRRKMTQIDVELRETKTAQRTNQEMLDLLRLAQADAGQLLATPNKLLESQPALRRLKEGLVDAQLRVAQLLGTMTLEHPLVISASHSQQEISERLHNELDLAIRGVELDLRLADSRLEMLGQQGDDASRRLNRLAGMRADYSMLASDVKQRTALVDKAQKDLADARASQAGAMTASLVCTVDAPEIGNRPVGPSNAVIVILGLAGGMFAGCGLLFLFVQPQSPALAVSEAPPVYTDHNGTSDRASSRQVLSLNDALLTLAQRNTLVRRAAKAARH